MFFSFTINGKPVDGFRNSSPNFNGTHNANPYQDTRNINEYEANYIKKYGYPRTSLDRLKMKEYEKSMREITIIDDIEIKDPFEKEKNSDKQEEIITSNISGNQV